MTDEQIKEALDKIFAGHDFKLNKQTHMQKYAKIVDVETEEIVEWEEETVSWEITKALTHKEYRWFAKDHSIHFQYVIHEPEMPQLVMNLVSDTRPRSGKKTNWTYITEYCDNQLPKELYETKLSLNRFYKYVNPADVLRELDREIISLHEDLVPLGERILVDIEKEYNAELDNSIKEITAVNPKLTKQDIDRLVEAVNAANGITADVDRYRRLYR